MTRLSHRLVALFMAPGHVRVRDWLAFRLLRLPYVRRLRQWWADDHAERPGFRAGDYR